MKAWGLLLEDVGYGCGDAGIERTAELAVAIGDVPAHPPQRVEGEQAYHDAREDEEHEGAKQEAGEGLAGDAARQADAAPPVALQRTLCRPVEMGGNLDDAGSHELGLVDDLDVDLHIAGLEAEGLDEGPVVAADHAAERGEVPLGGQREKLVGGAAQEVAEEGYGGGTAPLDVGGGYDDLCPGRHRGVQQTLDVVGAVAQVGVEGDDVPAPGLGEGEPQRLAEVEVGDVVEHPDPIVGGRACLGQLAGQIGAPVIDDDQLPWIAVLDAPQVIDQPLHGRGDQRLLVAGRHYHRDKGHCRHGRSLTRTGNRRVSTPPRTIVAKPAAPHRNVDAPTTPISDCALRSAPGRPPSGGRAATGSTSLPRRPPFRVAHHRYGRLSMMVWMASHLGACWRVWLRCSRLPKRLSPVHLSVLT